MKSRFTDVRTDEELVKCFLEGDNDCSGILYSRYYNKVYNKCWSFTRNSDVSLDLTQDILLKAIYKLVDFRMQSRFSTWLYSITFNHCIEYLRKKSKNWTISYEEAGEIPLDYSEQIPEEEIIDPADQVQTVLENLSECEKDILRMKYQQGFSIKDIENRLCLSPSAVKMRLARARQKAERLHQCRCNIKVAC